MRTQGVGSYQSVTGTKGGGAKGWGIVMSHPFQGGVGDRDESSQGETREEGGSTNHSQGEGVRADYVNVPFKAQYILGRF